MVAGIVIMGIGWKKIHAAQGKLVTDGIYSKVRHPQYSGLFLVSIGLMMQWLTPRYPHPLARDVYCLLPVSLERGKENDRALWAEVSTIQGIGTGFLSKDLGQEGEYGTIRPFRVGKQEAKTRQRENRAYLQRGNFRKLNEYDS